MYWKFHYFTRRYQLFRKDRSNSASSYSANYVSITKTPVICKKCRKELLKEFYQGELVRLIGVKVDNLVSTQVEQISLFDTPKNAKQQKIDKTLDQLKEKYGYYAITRAGQMKIDQIMDFKEETK